MSEVIDMATSVFVYPDKTYEVLGAERWICEWYTLPDGWTPELGCEEDSPDPDVLICHFTSHKTERAAVTAAKRRLKNGDDFYGSPVVRKQVVDWYVEEDRIAEWSEVGEPIYVA